MTTLHDNPWRLDWDDERASECELQDALKFWRQYHNLGSRNRVRSALAYYRRYHSRKEHTHAHVF